MRLDAQSHPNPLILRCGFRCNRTTASKDIDDECWRDLLLRSPAVTGFPRAPQHEEGCWAPYWLVAYFSGPTTSTLPVSVRARRSGRYMSSISAAGCSESAGRHGAHDVGELELRRAVRRQIPRRDEAVGAELHVRDIGDRASASRAPQRRRSPRMCGLSISKPAGSGSSSTSRAPWLSVVVTFSTATSARPARPSQGQPARRRACSMSRSANNSCRRPARASPACRVR